MYNERIMPRILKFFRSFHWKLTLSYTLVTVAALLVVQILAAILVWAVVTNSNIYPIALIGLVKEELAPQIIVYLDEPVPDVKGLAGWMQAAETSAGLTFQSLNFPVAQVSLSDFDENTNLLVLDKNLNLLAGIPTSIRDDYTTILDQADKALVAALAGEDDPAQISQITPDHSMIIAVPVISEAQKLLGVIVLKTIYPPRGILVGMISYFGGSLIFFTIAAGVVGTLFGFFTARGLTRRIHNVTLAIDGWSQGDFSTFIEERSEDELGQLVQRLNRMAEQLQNLLRTRQELATLEERNRLARDLHDGVKQQVFATAMQLGAAREMIEQNPNEAHKHLDQAEQLARQAQRELTAIIRELHPATLESKGLAPAIQELVDDWSRLNKIVAKITLSDLGRLPKEIEQTLFRFAQEALSNIAKHSQATHVEVELSFDRDDVSIMIFDNGRGFDIHAVEGKGIGLRSMRERIEALGGDFRAESTLGTGTRLSAFCQINKRESP
jgi:NarL family two-component system sensor histidine kinase LiaS